jgi:hypothetical protein
MRLTLHIAAARCPALQIGAPRNEFTSSSAFVCRSCGDSMGIEKPVEIEAKI